MPRSSAAIKTMRFTAILLALQQLPSPVGRAPPRPPFEALDYKLDSKETR
jgi:hypothetical protein